MKGMWGGVSARWGASASGARVSASLDPEGNVMGFFFPVTLHAGAAPSHRDGPLGKERFFPEGGS